MPQQQAEYMTCTPLRINAKFLLHRGRRPYMSLSKGGRELLVCFDKLSTGLEGWEGRTDSCVIPGQRFGSTVSMARSKVGRNMLFMVIEHFKNGDPKPIGERFKRKGRMMPEGVVYHASWIDPAAARCFQIMEADGVAPLEQWARVGRPRRFRDRARPHLAGLLGGAGGRKKPARLGRTGLHLELSPASLDRADLALPRQSRASCKAALVPQRPGIA